MVLYVLIKLIHFYCDCLAGFNGTFPMNIILMNVTPCLNDGTCIDDQNDYICFCPIDYEGKNCNQIVDNY